MKKISVIVRCFNREDTLARALKSILQQCYSSVEVILVDDGSTDDSGLVSRDFPEVIYHYQENRGLAGARETGLKLATGYYIAFLDADDYWKPDYLSRSIEGIEHGGCSFVFSNWETTGPGVTHEQKLELDQISYLPEVDSGDDQGWCYLTREQTRTLFMAHQPAVPSATVFRRDCLRLGWNTKAISADDWIMILGAIVDGEVNCGFHREKRWVRWIDGKNICEGTSDMGGRARNEIHDVGIILSEFSSKLDPAEKLRFKRMIASSSYDLGYILSRSGKGIGAFNAFLRSFGSRSLFSIGLAIAKIPVNWIRALRSRRRQRVHS